MTKTYIIAEAGVNHNGSLEMAMELIKAAASAGANAVKFQTFQSDKIASKYAEKAAYQKKASKQKESQLEMLKKLELSESDHFRLAKYCRELNINFMSTPFDEESVELLSQKLQLPILKISSGEVTNAPLLLKIAWSGKRVIMSTGMCTLGEVESALGVLAFGYLRSNETPSPATFQAAYASDAGWKLLQQNVTLLHCTTEYPAPFKDVNLRMMDTLRNAFQLPVGYSDHTEGIAVTIAAVARGATVIEKHFTLDRSLPGPDHKASLEPDELRLMVQSIREVDASLGSPVKKPAESEHKNKQVARKSLVAANDIKKGEKFTESNLTVKRPGNGISPVYYWDVIGTVATRDYKVDEVIER